MIFVEKIQAFDDVKLQGYPDGSIYFAHWVPDEIIVDTCQPMGDTVEIFDENKEKFEFRLGLDISTRVDPERVNAVMRVKCKLKIDRHGEKQYEWERLEQELEFRKDFKNWLGIYYMPGVDDFGRKNMVFELEYRYKWPDNTTMLISTEEIPETLLVFFKKYHPGHANLHGWATYDDNPAIGLDLYWPNWYRYWHELEIMNGSPFNIEKAVYAYDLESNGEWGTHYAMIQPDSAVKIYKIGYPAARPNGRVVDEKTHWDVVEFDTAFHVKGIHKFAFAARHENEHRKLFEQWWGTWDNYQSLKAEQDPDGDIVPTAVEQNYDPPLNPENPNTYHHPIDPPYDYIDASYNDFEFILYHGYHYQWKELIKDTLRVQLKANDWSCPGKQTEPWE